MSLPEGKISVIYNGVDLDFIDSAIDWNPYPGPGPNLLCIGRLWRPKGFDLALKALAHPALSDASLHIAGPHEDSAYLRELKQYAADNGISQRVHFLGKLDEAEKYAYMRHADAVLNPSRFEGLSIIAAESLASSALVIASDIGPFREVFADSALFFRRGDAQALAGRITEALDSPALARKLRARARARRSRFSVGAMVDGYVKSYEQAGA